MIQMIFPQPCKLQWAMGGVRTINTKGKSIEIASTILAGYERTNMNGFNADNGVLEIYGKSRNKASN